MAEVKIPSSCEHDVISWGLPVFSVRSVMENTCVIRVLDGLTERLHRGGVGVHCGVAGGLGAQLTLSIAVQTVRRGGGERGNG